MHTMQVIQLSISWTGDSSEGGAPSLHLRTLASLPRQPQWVLDARLLPLPQESLPSGLTCRGVALTSMQQPAKAIALAVGFTDNPVELYLLQLPSVSVSVPVPVPVSVSGRHDGDEQTQCPAPVMRVHLSFKSAL